MKTQGANTQNKLCQGESCDRCLHGTGAELNLPATTECPRPFLLNEPSPSHLPNTEAQVTFEMGGRTHSEEASKVEDSSVRFADFVQYKFVPEYVARRRSAGRAHFRAILKHVLPPEQVARAFAMGPGEVRERLKAVAGWPYLDSIPLCDINVEKIQHLASTALEFGYSVQTVTHIRNVIRAVFLHATRNGCYSGKNPATLVTLPAMARKEAHTLTLMQLKQVMKVMRYPEKHIALFAILTEMNVAEICGLQWKYVNLSNENHQVEEVWIPSRTIAVRKQSYRGDFEPVIGSRRRFVTSPDLLCSILRDLKNRKHFTAPEDFVLASRNGTPIYPENVAARRLKSIGKALDLPWLSWYVFHRTRLTLKSEYGRHLHQELENILPLNGPVAYQQRGVPVRDQTHKRTVY